MIIEALAPPCYLFDLGRSTDANRPSARGIGIAERAVVNDDPAGREVGRGQYCHQLFDRRLWPSLRHHELDGRVHFDEVVRRDARGHSNGDTRRPVDEKVRQLGRQIVGLGVGACVGISELHGRFVNLGEQRHCRLCQASFGVAAGGRRIVERAKVAVRLYERHGHGEGLAHPYERLIDRVGAVGVILPHGVADELRRLAKVGAGPGSHLPHGVEHPTLYRLEPVTHVGNRPCRGHRERVGHERIAHFDVDGDVDNVARKCVRKGALGHPPGTLRRRPPDFAHPRPLYIGTDMTRRIEVELTSERPDGTWTWRAAGAREPRGELDGALLFSGAKVGDVVKADADFDIEGITVIAVQPPKEARPEPERIELISSTPFEPVTARLSPSGGRREPCERRERRPSDRRGGDDSGDRPRRGRGERGERDGREGRPKRGERANRDDRRPRDRTPAEPERPKPKRLRPGRTHRKAYLDSLSDEERVVAEQLMRGGIAAVRKEIETQNVRASEDGAEEIKAKPLLALAERLAPKVRAAEWRDRAEAALAEVEEVDLRDLRSVVVAGEDAVRDAESRELAERLREALAARVESEHQKWLNELTATLADGRVVRALRLSSRPPKAGVPLPRELAERLTEAANSALGGEVGQQRLGVVIDAVAYSPVRTTAVLVEVPAKPSEELLETVRKVADRVPHIAEKLGLDPSVRPKRKRPPRRPKPPPKGEPKPAAAEAGASDADAAVGATAAVGAVDAGSDSDAVPDADAAAASEAPANVEPAVSGDDPVASDDASVSAPETA